MAAGRHRFKNGEKTEQVDRDALGRFVTGAAPGPGRPLGLGNRVTPLRASFGSVFDKLGGERALLKMARRYPRDFFDMMIRLEPKLFAGDLNFGSEQEPPVRVVVPFNHRCDPSLLGAAAHHESLAEWVVRVVADVEREQSAKASAAGEDVRQRAAWFESLVSAVRVRLEREVKK